MKAFTPRLAFCAAAAVSLVCLDTEQTSGYCRDEVDYSRDSFLFFFRLQ